MPDTDFHRARITKLAWRTVILVIFFKTPGFLAGILGIFILTSFTKSFGISYLWPAIPFNFQAMKDVILRLPLPKKTLRSPALKPKDPDRIEISELKKGKDDNKNEE